MISESYVKGFFFTLGAMSAFVIVGISIYLAVRLYLGA